MECSKVQLEIPFRNLRMMIIIFVGFYQKSFIMDTRVMLFFSNHLKMRKSLLEIQILSWTGKTGS